PPDRVLLPSPAPLRAPLPISVAPAILAGHRVRPRHAPHDVVGERARDDERVASERSERALEQLGVRMGQRSSGAMVRPCPESCPDRKSTRLNSSHGSISYAVL